MILKIYKKYSGVKKTKLQEILQNNFYKVLLKKDKKIDDRAIKVSTNNDLLINSIKDKEFLKFQIKEPIKRKYLYYFIDSLEIDLLNLETKTALQAFKALKIDAFDDFKSIKPVVEDLEKHYTTQMLKRKIINLKNELNEKVYEFHELNKEEIRYIKDCLY